MKRTYSILLIVALLISAPSVLQAHCQVPCGLYDDYARVKSMLEDAKTIEKAMDQINGLAKKSDALSQNQLTRWVMNKESHAQSIIETISDYFLTQRVKPSQDDYETRLKTHHAVILAAMKAKQGVDSQTAEDLKRAISALEAYYPEHKH